MSKIGYRDRRKTPIRGFSDETSYDIAKRCFASQHNLHSVQIVPLRALRKPCVAWCRVNTCADRRVFCLSQADAVAFSPRQKRLFQSPLRGQNEFFQQAAAHDFMRLSKPLFAGRRAAAPANSPEQNIDTLVLNYPISRRILTVLIKLEPAFFLHSL